MLSDNVNHKYDLSSAKFTGELDKETMSEQYRTHLSQFPLDSYKWIEYISHMKNNQASIDEIHLMYSN